MKYMIMMFGDQATMMESRTPEWVGEMIEFMDKLDGELKEAGEFVDGQGLADPTQAKTIRIANDVPVATDGPFAEAKESLAGYMIVEAAEERAIEIASRMVEFLQEPVEVRQVMDAAPDM